MLCLFIRSLIFIVLLSGFLHNDALAVPSFLTVKNSYQASDALLLDRHGDAIHELRVDPHKRTLAWKKLSDISPALIKAVIGSEDKRFYEHHGADWRALTSAAFGSIFGSGKRGASTITMQLASLIDENLKKKRSERTISRKWQQINTARDLEKTWSKEEILEAYLNLISFRGELEGIEATSRGIFQKDPGGIDELEAVILAALIRSPNADPEKVGERATHLAAVLGFQLSPEKIKEAAKEVFAKPYVVRKRIDLAPHVARILLTGQNARVKSTLDGSVQRFANEMLKQTIVSLSDQNVRDASALAVDNKTGDVLAYVGNIGNESSVYVDGVQARRQAGSTLKPFLYGLAIDKKIITAASLVEDSPLDLPTDRGVYRPENYDKEFRGFVPVRTALASSLNVPAVRTLNLIGIEAFTSTLRKYGFSNLREAADYGPSLALGTADVTLWELVNAYRTLANNGVWTSMRMSPKEKRSGRTHALSREAAFIISSILSDREARSATFSLESPLATRFWSAAKTGTSKDMRDNWCVGYSEKYTVGVWVGNFSGASMWNVSGVSGAAPAWLEIMNFLHRGTTSNMPQRPAGVVEMAVSIKNDASTVRKQEFFLAGTGPGAIEQNKTSIQPKITYPAPNMVIALDPDIPADLQKIFFKTSMDDNQSLRIKIGEKTLEAGTASWQPQRGVHHIYLMTADGVIVDDVSFEVR